MGTMMADRALIHKKTSENRQFRMVIRQTDEERALLGCWRCRSIADEGIKGIDSHRRLKRQIALTSCNLPAVVGNLKARPLLPPALRRRTD